MASEPGPGEGKVLRTRTEGARLLSLVTVTSTGTSGQAAQSQVLASSFVRGLELRALPHLDK